MMRTFVAVPLPEPIRKGLSAVSRELKSLDLHASFPLPESMHLTLKFLGEIAESKAVVVKEALDRLGDQCSAFQVEVRELGVFPHLGNPRVVWAGVGRVDPLWDLQRRVEQELKPLGFSPEKKPFHPHLTLARIKSRKNIVRLIEYVEQQGRDVRIGEFGVAEFHLYQSFLKPQGAEYRVLSTCRLKEE